MPAIQTVSPPNTVGPGRVKGFDVYHFEEKNMLITGVSRDSGGAALGSCTVKLFNTATDMLEQTQVSDVNGNYSFVVDKTQNYYLVEYKAGSPDVAGTSVNTLAGV